MTLTEALVVYCTLTRGERSRAEIEEAGRIVRATLEKLSRSLAGEDRSAVQLEDLVSRAALRLLTVDVVGRIACKSVSGSADAGPSRDAVARSYLRRILANLLVDEWRKAQRRREVPLDDDSGTRAAGAGAVPRPPPGGDSTEPSRPRRSLC